MRIMYYEAATKLISGNVRWRSYRFTSYTVSWSDIIAADRDNDSDGKDNTSSVYFSACKLPVLECPCTRLVASYVQYGANKCCYCKVGAGIMSRYQLWVSNFTRTYRHRHFT